MPDPGATITTTPKSIGAIKESSMNPLKIIKVDCDWKTMNAEIKIQRINPSHGAFESNRYKRHNESPSAYRMCKILQKSEYRHPEHYYRGG